MNATSKMMNARLKPSVMMRRGVWGSGVHEPSVGGVEATHADGDGSIITLRHGPRRVQHGSGRGLSSRERRSAAVAGGTVSPSCTSGLPAGAISLPPWSATFASRPVGRAVGAGTPVTFPVTSELGVGGAQELSH